MRSVLACVSLGVLAACGEIPAGGSDAAPPDANRALTVTAVDVPAMGINDEVTITIHVSGQPSASLSATILPGADGQFDPEDANLSLDASGAGTLDVSYAAPPIPGTFHHQVIVTGGDESASEVFDTVIEGCELVTEDTLPVAAMFDDDTTLPFAIALGSDGTSRWVGSGNSTAGDRLVQYTADGSSVVMRYAPGIDFRTLFTKVPGRGPILARGYPDQQLLRMDSPGTFVADVLLVGGSVAGTDMTIVYDNTRRHFVGNIDGSLEMWNDDGEFFDSLSLENWGVDNPAESGSQKVVTACGYYLTYANGIASVFDGSGQRVDMKTLTDAPTTVTTETLFSLSYADGLLWVLDVTDGTWRGWDLGLH